MLLICLLSYCGLELASGKAQEPSALWPCLTGAEESWLCMELRWDSVLRWDLQAVGDVSDGLECLSNNTPPSFTSSYH